MKYQTPFLVLWKKIVLTPIFCLSNYRSAKGRNYSSKSNIAMITIDTLRSRLGCYGDTLAKTPNIDRLAQNGVLFRQSQKNRTITLPSYASS